MRVIDDDRGSGRKVHQKCGDKQRRRAPSKRNGVLRSHADRTNRRAKNWNLTSSEESANGSVASSATLTEALVKLAIDSYCYHRYFGEVYPNIERDPGFRITTQTFLERAQALGVAGVSLESCFFPQDSEASSPGQAGAEAPWSP